MDPTTQQISTAGGYIRPPGPGRLTVVSGRHVGVPPSRTTLALNIRHSYPGKESRRISPRSTSTPGGERAPSSLNFKRLFKEARDFLPFVRLARTAAETGDADAQYYLSEALRFCADATADVSYGIYFVNNGERLVVGRSVSQEGGVVRSEEVASEIDNRCGALRRAIENDESFGSADDWLSTAADKGSAAAQSTLALMAFRNPGSWRVGGSFGSQIRTGDDARALLVDVAADADPVALWNLGAAQGQFSQSYEDRLVNQLSLWLVSCRHGLDCGPEAPWVLLACQSAGCPHNVSGPDLIGFIARAYREKVEERAEILADALQAGTFTQVSFPTDSGAGELNP